MGYRNYIALLPKKEHEKIKNFTKEELYAYKKQDLEDGHVGVYDITKKALYELGKYCEFGDTKFYKPVFNNKKLQKEYTEEHDFYIVEKEFLEHIIKDYTKKVKAYYEEMLNPFFEVRKPKGFLNSIKKGHDEDLNTTFKFDFTQITDEEQNALFKMIEHIRGFGGEWGVKSFLEMIPYSLHHGEAITTSWKYEYGIFELVRIYKEFDWKKNLMIYYGY